MFADENEIIGRSREVHREILFEENEEQNRSLSTARCLFGEEFLNRRRDERFERREGERLCFTFSGENSLTKLRPILRSATTGVELVA